MKLPPLCFTRKMVPSFLQTWRLAFRPMSSILVSLDHRILFLLVWESFRFLLANSKWAVMCLLLRSGFHLATIIKAWLVECCRDGCPSEDSPISTEELWSSFSNSGALSWSPPWPALGRVLVVPNFFHLRMIEDLQCCRHVLVTFPRSVPRHNPVSELYRQCLQPHGLVFAVTCTVNCGTLCTLYRCMPFQILPNKCNLPQVDAKL